MATSSDTYTLYRSSDGVPSARIHWATFNVDDSGGGTGTYNKGNCEMDADVLNANLKRLNNGAMPVRFWCEHGTAHDVDNRR